MEYNRQTLHAQYENVWLQYALSKQTRVNKATNIAVVKDVCTSSYLYRFDGTKVQNKSIFAA